MIAAAIDRSSGFNGATTGEFGTHPIPTLVAVGIERR